MSQNIPDSLPNTQNPVNDEESIDLKAILANVVTNWLLFVISILVCLAIAFIYATYTQPEWNVYSKILVEDQKNNPTSALSGSLNSDISSLFNVKSNADNEVQILKSRNLMATVIKAMQLNVRTYQMNGLKSIEVYDDAPFTVKLTYKADTLVAKKYKIKVLSEDSFELTNSEDKIDLKAKYNQPIRLQQYDLVLQRNFAKKLGKDYAVSIESTDAAVEDFTPVFNAALSDKQSTTIDLTFSYPNSKKGEAILNGLMHQYLLNNLQNKVQIADSTMAFINGRIAIVGNELNNIEKQFEVYKVQNRIADITEQSKALVGSAADYYKKLNEQEIQLTVVNDLEKFLANPANKRVVPSSLVVPEAMGFNQAINSYNELLLNREKALLSYTESNPVVQNLNQQIESSRVSLLNNIKTYRQSLVVGKQQLQQQNSTFAGQLQQVPAKERNYLDFARQQQLKQELYLYLLQKREETAISKTSTISSSRIIDPAKSEFKPYKPKKATVYLIGFIIGLVLPSAYLLVKELLNIRINNKADIEKITSTAVVGEISHNNEGKNLVIGNNSRSIISEQFRSLRTNLQYVLDFSKPNVMLFTSSMSGEGKSFLSLNLGSAMALTGKKVVFMEMDLRKPKLSSDMGADNTNGFSNYVISQSQDIRSVLKPTAFNENCYLISSGPIPPNPTELLINRKLDDMIAELKKEFDFIIIDCAPIGLVTDALLLEKFADITFYVVRQGYTYKSQLNIVNDLKQNKRVKNLYMIVNDIKSQRSGYAAYGQGYGYGYGYGYGDYMAKDKKGVKNWFKKS